MANLDEDKVKRLLHDLVRDIENLVESNLYRKDLIEGMHAKIRTADLLTNQHACATMKRQEQQKLG